MDRIPFGVKRLDALVGGGAPAGSVVLLAGEAGAGAREFVYTSAAMNGLAKLDAELFELFYGSLAPNVRVPEAIHYVSFASGETRLRREVELVMDEEVAAGLDAATFHDLSTEYFGVSPVPVEWYEERTATIEDLGARHGHEGVLGALGERLDEHAPENLVVIDSLTDLVGASDGVSWPEIAVVLRGLCRAAAGWKGLVLVHVSRDALSAREHGLLVDAVDGTMEFTWESGGSTRARTMIVKQFRGVLSRIEAEDIVRFETEIGPSGFDVSDVRKIR